MWKSNPNGNGEKKRLKGKMGPWNRNDIEQCEKKTPSNERILFDGVAQSILVVHRNALTHTTYSRLSHLANCADAQCFFYSTTNQIVDSLKSYKIKHQETRTRTRAMQRAWLPIAIAQIKIKHSLIFNNNSVNYVALSCLMIFLLFYGFIVMSDGVSSSYIRIDTRF